MACKKQPGWMSCKDHLIFGCNCPNDEKCPCDDKEMRGPDKCHGKQCICPENKMKIENQLPCPMCELYTCDCI